MKRNQRDQFIEHLKSIDHTGNIKFTDEPEIENSIPLLDTQVTRKDDGSLKVKVYREKTHTDQYLNFKSHHPLQHKLGLVRTLNERSETL